MEDDADVEDDDVEEEDRSQDREAHFVGACAIEMHLRVAQEPFCMEIYMRTDISQEPFCRKVTGKMAADLRGQHFVRACEVDMHMNMSQEAFRAEIYRENAGPVFCASLRSRNAHGHVTKHIVCGNLQGKCRTLPIPFGLNTYGKNPSVWPRCFGELDIKDDSDPALASPSEAQNIFWVSTRRNHSAVAAEAPSIEQAGRRR